MTESGKNAVTGVITGIKRMEIHDGAGIRTTVFFKGCPLRCLWCHNPENISYAPTVAYYPDKCAGCGGCLAVCPQKNADPRAENCLACGRCAEECTRGARFLYGERTDVQTLCERLLADKPFFDASGGGVTLSGGECLAKPDFAVALAKELRGRGVSVDIDTCGFVPRKAFEAILPYADTFLYDLKAMDSDLHRRLTGRENGLILDNLRYLSEVGASVEIRIPLVMGVNDGEVPAIADFLRGQTKIRRVKVLRYHDMARSKYRAIGMEDTMPHTATSPEDVEKAERILTAAGLTCVG